MKKFFFIFIISTSFLYAQNGNINIKGIDSLGNLNYKYITKFIQVEVHDSISRGEASSFDVLISINDKIFPDIDSVSRYDYNLDIRIKGSDYQKTKSDLEKIIKSRKLHYKYYLHNSTLPNEYFYKDNYLVNIPCNEKIFNDFFNDLKKIKTIEPYRVTNIYFENDDKIEGILFKNLLKKGREKSLMIAKLSKVKLGKIIEINEDSTNYIKKLWYHPNDFIFRSIIIKYLIEDE